MMRATVAVGLLVASTYFSSADAAECGNKYFAGMDRYEKTTPKESFKGAQGKKFCVHMRKRADFSEQFIRFLEANPSCKSDDGSDMAQSMRDNRPVYADILRLCSEANL